MSTTGSLPPSRLASSSAPADERLSLLVRGFQISRAIHVAVRLGIPDLIADGPRATSELAVTTATDAAALTRLLRCLAAFGLVREVSPSTFVLQDEAAVLRSNHPRSLRPMVLFQGSENYWETWGGLADCMRTGVTANGLLTGDADPNAYRERHPESAALFHAAMTARVKPIADALHAAYDFSKVGTVVDIGGGHGYLIVSLLLRYPELRGIVLDLPSVVDGARAALLEAGVADRCDAIGGSMFERIPSGADVYLMSSIVHDWPDADVITLLRKTCDAMNERARLLVIDFFQPLPGDESAAAQAQVLDDLNMLVRTGGRGRRVSELGDLFSDAGLHVAEVRPLGFARSVVEGRRCV